MAIQYNIHIVCNTSQSKFRNHYFLFLFAFSILSQLFLIWGCILNTRKSWPPDTEEILTNVETQDALSSVSLPCCLSQPRSWMKPMKGAMPVPGPIMITGFVDLKGRRNWDLRMYMGTVALCPLSVGILFFSQLVATPLLTRPVLVSYSTTTAQMWMLLGWTCHRQKTLQCTTDSFQLFFHLTEVICTLYGVGLKWLVNIIINTIV